MTWMRMGQTLLQKLTFSHVEQVAFLERVLIILGEKAFCRTESP